MWVVVAVRTVLRSLSGKMFFAPCLGTDLFSKELQEEINRPTQSERAV